MNIIETQHLTKSYKNFTAVSDLNLHIKKGTVYGFLGPNGAGKSTTMKMFLGLTQPTSGSFSAYSGASKKQCFRRFGAGRTGTFWKPSGKALFPWYEAASWTGRSSHWTPAHPDFR